MATCTAPVYGHRTASGAAACPACGGRYGRYSGYSSYSNYGSYSSPSYSSSGSSGGGSGSSARPRWSRAGSSVVYTPAECAWRAARAGARTNWRRRCCTCRATSVRLWSATRCWSRRKCLRICARRTRTPDQRCTGRVQTARRTAPVLPFHVIVGVRRHAAPVQVA